MQTTKARFAVSIAAIVMLLGAMPASAAASSDHKDASLNPVEPNAQVTIRNYNSLDVQIVAVTEAGKRYRLGTVNHGAERTFVVPECLIDSGIQFRLKVYSLARAVAPSIIDNQLAGVKTQPLSIGEGEEIRLMVKSPLVSSFIERG